jgi:hypothetical protein
MGDRSDGMGGGFGGGGFGGGMGGMGGPGRDTVSAIGGNFARMGNFRGDPGLGGGGAVGFSGITSREQALAAAAQHPGMAMQSGLLAAIARGDFGPNTGGMGPGRMNKEGMPAPARAPQPPPTAYAPPSTPQFSPPTRSPLPGFSPAPPVGPTTTRPQPGWGIPGLPVAATNNVSSIAKNIASPFVGAYQTRDSDYQQYGGRTYSNLGEFGPAMGYGDPGTFGGARGYPDGQRPGGPRDGRSRGLL